VHLHGKASLLARCIGKTELSANTDHKQEVRALGRGMVITSTAPDEVIESFEDPDRPLFLGVEWHRKRFTPSPVS
jgi:gamma-glutamyl-gamma-aminobutyrate hydrolase PuuD